MSEDVPRAITPTEMELLVRRLINSQTWELGTSEVTMTYGADYGEREFIAVTITLERTSTADPDETDDD